MANEQLPLGQIQPSARPVNTFFQSARQEPVAPARPVQMPAVEGIRTLGTGGVGGFQTENKFSSLLKALQPFSAQFMKAAENAGQVYVEDQFQRGINEGLKAQRLLQGQIEQSADGYAADNRKLSRQDMPAALLMDSMNPYRRGGIQAGLAQMAAADIEPHFLSAYKKERGRLSELEPGSPEVVGFQATKQADVLRYYGLDTSMPAVQKYFIPQANKAWEKITERHWDDNQKTLKAQTPVLITGETTALVRNARTAGVVSGYDPTTGAPVSYRLDGDSTEVANAEKLLSSQVESVFDKYAKRVGISGESLPLLKNAWEELWGQSLAAEAASGGTVNNQLMRNVLRRVGIGAPVNQGDGTQRRPTAADVWGKGALDDLMKYDTAEAEVAERRRKAAVDAYEADLAAATAGVAPGPELQSAIQTVNAKHQGSGISTADMVASQTKVIPRMREIASYGMDPSAGQRVLMDLDSVPLVDFDPKAAQQRLLDALPNVPDGEKDNLLRDGQAIIRRRTEEKGKFDPLVGKAVEKVVAREIAERYPNTILEMSRDGKPVDIYALRSNSNANVREAASRIESGLTSHIQSRLYEAQRKNPAMSATEKQGVINGAIEEYTNSSYFNKLFPGVGGVPNANGTPSAAPGGAPGAGGGGGGAGPGRPVYRGPVYSSSQLRNLGDGDVKGYNQRPLLSPGSLQSELNSAVNGGGFSADLQAAARRAGTTPLRFVEEQLKFNPSIQVPKEMLEDIRSKTRASAGRQAASRQVAFNPITGAQEVGNWALNLLMPAAAASEFPTSLRRPQQVATGLRQPSYSSGGGAIPFGGSGGGGSVNIAGFSPILAVLRSGEGGWNSANRGTAGDTPGGVAGLSGMTLGQWKGLQARGYNALGAYQFIPKTLKLAASELGLPDSTVMTPEVQGRLAVQLMVGTKRPRLAAYLRGKSNDLGAALDDLALEWASVHTRGGGTAYAGIGGNAASISRSSAGQALVKARQAFLAGDGGGGGGGSSQFLRNPRGIRPSEFGSGYGAQESFRRHPHEGSDAQVPQGTPLGLAVGGQVVRVRRTNSGAREANGGYGNYIDVRLPSGQILRMAHLSWIDPVLRDGMPFVPNQMLARTGGRPGTPGAGRSTGPHLHHEQLLGVMGEAETTRGKVDPRRHGGSSLIRLGAI